MLTSLEPIRLPVETEDADLASEINSEHEAANCKAAEAVEHARKCGELLIEQKGKLEHGEWMPWVEKHCSFAYSTAAKYIQLAEGLIATPITLCHGDIGIENILRTLKSGGSQFERKRNEAADLVVRECISPAEATELVGLKPSSHLTKVRKLAKQKIDADQVLEQLSTAEDPLWFTASRRNHIDLICEGTASKWLSDLTGIPERKIKDALTIHNNAIPAVQAAFRSGAITTARSLELSRLSDGEQEVQLKLMVQKQARDIVDDVVDAVHRMRDMQYNFERNHPDGLGGLGQVEIQNGDTRLIDLQKQCEQISDWMSEISQSLSRGSQ